MTTAAVVATVVVAVVNASDGKAGVRFSDGTLAYTAVDCDYWNLNLSVIFAYPARGGYVRFPVYSYQTGVTTNPRWNAVNTDGFLFVGPLYRPWGKGKFRIYSQVGRYGEKARRRL
jgi:hypothetical protein